MSSTVRDACKEFEAKKKALKKQKNKVDELKKLWIIEEIKYIQLEQELISLQSATINKLPSELLSIIFKLSICDNRKLVRRLLLVCKYWKHLVITDVQLWNEIHLELPDDQWDTRSWFYRNIPFVDRCLELSQSSLLQITLNLTALKSTRAQISDKILASFDNVSGCQSFLGHRLLEEWLAGLDYDDLEQDEDIMMECQPDNVFDMLEILVGDNGKHMGRWQSLEVHFPVFSPELAYGIWDSINHPIPQLERAHLYRLGVLEAGDNFLVQFPDFSHIRHLKVSELRNWDFLHSFSPSMQTLSVQTLFGDSHSLDLPYFANLTSLTLRRGFSNQDPDVRPEIPDVIALPLLEELIFIGYFTRLHKTKFILPRLQTLVLKWTYDRPTLNLPKLQPKRVHWEPFRQKECKTPNLADAVLRRFLRHFIHSTTLIVPTFEKKILVGILRELWAPGGPALALGTVAFHMNGEIVETMKPKQIIRKW